MSVLERSKAYTQKWGLPHELPDRVADIAQRVVDANEDICDRSCETPITYWPDSGSDAVRGRISIGARSIGETDGRAALSIGHELAHVFLGHVSRVREPGTKWEDDADCVGSIMATRAGFAPAHGLLKQRAEAAAYMDSSIPHDIASRYSSPEASVANVGSAHRKTRSLMDAGKPIDRATIKEICGVAP